MHRDCERPRVLKRSKARLRRLLGREFSRVQAATVELNDIGELRKVFGWREEPLLDDPALHEFQYVEDVNQRRLRDAEVIGTVTRNAARTACLEIGTSSGRTTALMAGNAPAAMIYTVNIPPEEVASGSGGTFTTHAIGTDAVGAYYRERGHTNVRQIFANTATWEPDVEKIDVAFIDGCHDTDFVFNDTRKVMRHMAPGSFVLWHDYNLALTGTYPWIHSVVLGVENLLEAGIITSRIFHVRDSWVGVQRR
jgi:hypothetical protein